jgi:O-antigen/teichoic acid export membrane protein
MVRARSRRRDTAPLPLDGCMMGPLGKLKSMVLGGGALKKKMMRASAWMAGQTMLNAVLRLGSNLITTRLLYPEAFGLIAILMMIQTACMMFTDVGISKSIVRDKDGDKPAFLGALWTLQIAMLAIVSLIMLALAGLLWAFLGEMAPPDSVFADPVLPAMLAVAALGPVFQGFNTPARHVAMRTLDFKRIALFELGTYVVSLSVMLGLLFLFPSVWVLLFGILFQNLNQAVLSHVVFPTPRVRPSFDREILRGQWQFGRYVMGSSPMQFFYTRGDRLLLGLFLDAKSFGLYSVAMIWVDSLRMALTKVTNSVGFAGIAEINRTDPDSLPRKFERYQGVLTVLNFAACGIISIGGPILIALLYSDDYQRASDFLVVLGLLFLFRRFFPAAALLLAKGDSKAFMYITAMRAIGLLLMVPIGFYLDGLSGAVFGVALAGAWSVPLTLMRMAQHMPAGYVRRELMWVLAISALFAVVWVVDPIG